jgi:hypothetical protein
MKVISDPLFGEQLSYDIARITRTGSMWTKTLDCCETAFEQQMLAWQSSTRVIIVPVVSLEKIVGIPSSLREKMIAARANAQSIIGVEMNQTQAPLIVIAANDKEGVTTALEALMKEPTLVSKVWAVVKK